MLVAGLGASAASAATSNLTITKTISPSQPVAGQNATYTITVHNPGPDNDTGVVVHDTLPAGVTYISARADVPAHRTSCATSAFS